ncbi:hypothetical protein BGW38_001635 [Lunasporangiospora selenospora]|uniref:Methyltransferase domain-containing protein n=1 Tax=Lunasporangiospora selenospora TaxID=979761 RepID=A0A9P6FUC1_9FUNG|nr:hypothetical protein BGW38_001635 [Lunasporangiospora selenospora]
MVDWVEENYEDSKETCSVLDLGCGNGHLLLDLAELGFEDLTGIDYSPAAIRLAQAVAEGREVDNVIRYVAVDFLADVETEESQEWRQSSSEESTTELKKFKVMLDKGTYDAISLHQKKKKDAALAASANSEASDKTSAEEDSQVVLAENDQDMEELAERYPKKVANLMQDDGRLLITSCNWTQDELIQRFSQVFEYESHIKYPTFRFGGVVGQTISSVIFKKKNTSASSV